MKTAYLNRLHKVIKTEDGKDCGVISFHQHGDIIAIGASKMRPSLIDTDKFKFDEDKGKKIADSRAKKAFNRFIDELESDDPSMLVVDLSKDKTFSSFGDIVKNANVTDYEDEETNRKQLALYI